jgi:hypothetical protein
LLKQLAEIFTAQRLAAMLVFTVGSVMGAFASHGLTPVQWAGAATAMLSAIAVAVIVHRWPAKARAPAGGRAEP